jgi:hypothetical protein
MGEYSGMTVNERLYVSGLMEKFDNAVKGKDINEIISILKSVDLTNEAIDPVLKQLGLI